MENQGNPGRESLDDYKAKKEKLIKELEQLETGTHAVYIQREQQLRKELNETLVELKNHTTEQLMAVQRDYKKEILAATNDFERQAYALQQKMIFDLEHQKKLIFREYQLSRICQHDQHQEEATNNHRELRSNLRLFYPAHQGNAIVNRQMAKVTTLLSKAEIEEDLRLIGQMDQ
ncbi:uncharacterized protein LOC125955496 [Anopheles darlingi]|uniref:uncharacterized protein LOC125955496 n=1 Tax=Anopheles darlingi TaxID=43151 RepID=UPI0021005F71|nr:uncharacterized protein LOC125955496 [Anopheles darlingi]